MSMRGERAMGVIPYGPMSGVIVTGAGSGIGRATALALAAASVGIDVRDTAEFDRAIAVSREGLGSIGGFVHAAGIVGAGPIDDLDEAVWDAVVAVHLRSAALLIRALVPDLVAEVGSAVVLIASIEALISNERIPAYSAAKAGMLGLARSSAARLGARGVRVNSVCPGFIDTPMLQPALEREPSARAIYERRVPLRRLGRPEDIARAVRFLLSDDAAYITAAELV